MEVIKKPEVNPSVVELDLDQAFQKIGIGLWQLQLVLTLCVGIIADASEATLLSFLGPCAQVEFVLSHSETSFINSVVFAGAIVGALFFGFFADAKGRRPAYALSLVILLAFGVGTFFTRSYVALVLCRGCVGFGLGGTLAPYDFLAETVPVNIRGICCLVSSLFWGVGSVLTVLAAWLVLGSHGWRAVALVCALPSLFALVAVIALPESPRWLLSQGKSKEAVEVIQRAAKMNGVDLGVFTLKASTHSPNTTDFWEMFKPPLLKTTFLLSINWATHGFCYYALIQLSATLFKTSTSGRCSFAYKDILIPAVSEPIFIIVAMFFVERSRRITHSFNFFSVAVFILFVGLPLPKSSLTVLTFFFSRMHESQLFYDLGCYTRMLFYTYSGLSTFFLVQYCEDWCKPLIILGVFWFE